MLGYLDYADGEPHWRQPKGERKLIELKDDRLWSLEYGGPQDWLERSIAHLASHTRAVSPGTFVFVLSDFIPTPPSDTWLAAIENRWDLVPVVIQDPTWEQTFPEVSGVVLPLRDPATGRVGSVRLRKGEAALASLQQGATLSNVAPMAAHTQLAFLGDVFVLPSFVPLANAFSVGDVLASLGVALWIVELMRSAPATQPLSTVQR